MGRITDPSVVSNVCFKILKKPVVQSDTAFIKHHFTLQHGSPFNTVILILINALRQIAGRTVYAHTLRATLVFIMLTLCKSTESNYGHRELQGDFKNIKTYLSDR